MPLILLYILPYLVCSQAQWINYPASGTATLTHYTLPLDFVAGCGCAPASTHYPTVALSQMAFGSSMAFGPGCGKCFNITLLNSFISTPPFYPNVTKSVVVKVTDLCPISSNWCTATPGKPNQAGQFLNFDLAWPSPSVPEDFFPSDPAVYGYADFGVWNVSYTVVPCSPDWSGSTNTSALGAVSYLGAESVCCPADPVSDPATICRSYSDLNGIPPEAAPGAHSSALTLLGSRARPTLHNFLRIRLPNSIAWPLMLVMAQSCMPF